MQPEVNHIYNLLKEEIYNTLERKTREKELAEKEQGDQKKSEPSKEVLNIQDQIKKKFE